MNVSPQQNSKYEITYIAWRAKEKILEAIGAGKTNKPSVRNSEIPSIDSSSRSNEVSEEGYRVVDGKKITIKPTINREEVSMKKRRELQEAIKREQENSREDTER